MTTILNSISPAAWIIETISPRRTLEVGDCAGHWPLLVRRSVGAGSRVEALRTSEASMGRSDALYDRVHVGDFISRQHDLAGEFDMIILDEGTSLSDAGTARRMLESMLKRATYLILVVSSSSGVLGGLSRVDILEFPLVRMTSFNGGALFVLSAEDPLSLRDIPAGEGEPWAVPGPPEHDLDRVLDRVAEQSFELSFIKKSISYRAMRKLRGGRLWQVARRLKGVSSDLVSITPLGERHHDSRGCEVWVRSICGNQGEIATPWDFVEKDGEWFEKEDDSCPYGRCLVGVGEGELAFRPGEDPELRFGTHNYSGKVRVSYLGRSEVIDLYTPEGGEVRVHPARTPMANAPRPSALHAARQQSSPTGPADDFSPRQQEFIASMRRDGATTAAVHCPRWLGVTNSTRNLFTHLYPVPETPEAEPYHLTDDELERHAHALIEAGVRHVVFSGGDHAHLRLAEMFKKLRPDSRCDMLWHGNFVQWSDDYAWSCLTDWIDAARKGTVHTIGTVKKGMEEFLTLAGVRSTFVMNYVPGEVEDARSIEGDEMHLGLWMSGTLWKTPNVMLAAMRFLPNARLHTAGLDTRTADIAAYFNLKLATFHGKTIPHARLLDEMRRTHLTLYVTFAECCPMIPLESLSVGVPALVGPASHLFEDHPFLSDRLIVPFPDRPEVIARYAKRAIAERAEIVRAYAEYHPGYVERARRSVADFLSDS